MGTNRDSDGPPPDGGGWPERSPDLPELPDLPPDVRIPDDPAELAAEAAQVRAELAGRPGPGHRRRVLAPGAGPVRLPAVIMSVAVVITLVSLIAIAWSRPPVPTDPSAADPAPLPAVTLYDQAGQATTTAGLAPAVIMFVEECRCGGLIDRTAAEAPAGVTVAVVGPSAPSLPAGLGPDADVRSLADPDGALRQALELGAPPAEAATVVLVDRTGVVQVSPAASSVDPYLDALARLG